MKAIRDVLTGKVTRWNEIYPSSRLGDIQLVFDNKNSSTVRFAIDSICQGQELAGNVSALKTNREVIDFVTKNPGAMGVVGVNWLSDRNDSTGLSFNKEVRLMSVSTSVEPTPENSYQPYPGIPVLTASIRFRAASTCCSTTRVMLCRGDLPAS